MIICIWQQLEVQKSLEEMILVILHQEWLLILQLWIGTSLPMQAAAMIRWHVL